MRLREKENDRPVPCFRRCFWLLRSTLIRVVTTFGLCLSSWRPSPLRPSGLPLPQMVLLLPSLNQRPWKPILTLQTVSLSSRTLDSLEVTFRRRGSKILRVGIKFPDRRNREVESVRWTSNCLCRIFPVGLIEIGVIVETNLQPYSRYTSVFSFDFDNHFHSKKHLNSTERINMGAISTQSPMYLKNTFTDITCRT